jgi:hypothetical protein
MGHVNNCEITIHTPKWIVDSKYDFSMTIYCGHTDNETFEHNQHQINKLKSILENGPHSNEAEAILNKEKLVRRQQYEQLKKEFEPELEEKIFSQQNPAA